MHFLIKRALLAVTILAIFGPAMAIADATSEIHLTPDGLFTAKRIIVVQKAGTNLFSRARWGQTFIRVTVLVNKSTDISKNHGEKMTIADIKEGDILDIEGALVSGADTLMINPTRIRDISLERESETLAGTVESINRSDMSFMLSNKSFGSTKIALNASTPIRKGSRSIEFGDISTGDKILSASGTYDYRTNALEANKLEVYQNKAVFTARNFQGTLKSISGTTLPAMLTVKVGSMDYGVYLGEKSSVLNRNKGTASLNRFVAGDIVRFYGSIRETNLSEVDASVVRDLEF